MKKHIAFFSVVIFWQIALFGMIQEIDNLVYSPIMAPVDESLVMLRQKFDRIGPFDWKTVIKADPTISARVLPMKERPGVCYDYAMKTLLHTHGITKKFITPGCQAWIKVLPTYFKQVENVKKGDLSVHVACDEKIIIKHFGLVTDPADLMIESKWGVVKAIFTHNLFALPSGWGNGVIFFRLRKEYRSPGADQDNFIQHIAGALQHPLEMQQILFHNKLALLEHANQRIEQSDLMKIKIVHILEQIACVSVDPRNHIQRTPLMLAVLNDNVPIARLLLAYGANKNLKDMYGKTSLMIAQQRENKKMLELLMQESAVYVF